MDGVHENKQQWWASHDKTTQWVLIYIIYKHLEICYGQADSKQLI